MTDIDYEALARAGYIGFFGSDDDWSEEPATHLWEREVRAVVAALRDQGFVVVRAEVFRGIVNAVDVPRPVFPPYLDEAKAALAAPEYP
jgi:hypothetical protein